MPERRFYTWRQPPRLVDRAYAHPGTSSLSIAAVLVGVGLVAFVFTPGQPSTHLLEPLPNWLQIWLGVALVIGGIASTYGLFKTWADLSQGWAWERLGWTLQLGAWGALALLFTALIPATVLTVPLLVSATSTAYLRLFALALIERDARALIEQQERP